MHITPRSPLLTLAAALIAIDGWTDLSASRRALLIASLLRIAKMLGDPPALIVLTPQFVRTRLLARPPSSFGIGEGTMRNRRSLLRQVMVRLGVIDACDAPVSAAWLALLAPLSSRQKAPLAKLVDYCAMKGIEPGGVSDAMFSDFMPWLETRTLTAAPKKLFGSCRRAWNHFAASVPGWPAARLTAATDHHQYISPLNAFTQAFRDSVQRLGNRLAGKDVVFRRGDNQDQSNHAAAPPTPSRRPNHGLRLRPITVAKRQDHVRWAASALVASGEVEIGQINAVTDLVQPPDRAHVILEFLFHLHGEAPSAGAMHVFEVLLMLAKHEAKLPPQEITELRAWRHDVVPSAGRGMSPARRTRIMAVMEPERLALLLQLPDACMAQAQALLPDAPRDATSLALRAVAVQMLLTTQLRLFNLITMKVGQHLQADDPARRRYQRINIAAGETKNSHAISRPIGATTRAIMDIWIRHFRPLHATDADGYLFPGHGAPHITRQGFRDAVKSITRLVVGIALTPHDFRALAGKIHLHFNPGDYGTVKQMLGHTSIQTTIDSYTSDETDRAVEDFDRLILRVKGSGLRTPKTPAKRRTPPRAPLVSPSGKPGGKGRRG